MKLKGYLLAALAAATYGTNPAFAVPLYEQGMNANSVLLFRYILSLPILAMMLAYRRRSFEIERKQIVPVAVLGIMMAISSLGLYESYNYMNSGIASTLLFIYPILVAVLMTFFFHERFRSTTAICLVIMGIGLAMLVRSESGFSLSLIGCLFVFISALTYALYLVMTNVAKSIKGIPTLKLLFYQLMFGSLIFVMLVCLGQPLTLPAQPSGWLNLIALATLPTVVSLWCTTIAIKSIGSTPTAIFGALEPVTAVILSVIVLDQSITLREIGGGALIVIATSMVVAADSIDKVLLRTRRMFPSLRRKQ